MPGFRRVSEEELLRAWLFRVDRFHLLDPDDKPFDRFVIRHPGAVTVVPVHDDGTVTLVRQYRAAVDALVLELPAGTLDHDGEEPQDAARRELAEEAGLEATSWELLIQTWNSPGISDQHTLVYLATGLSSVPSRPQGVEEGYMTIETIHFDDIDALVGGRDTQGRDDGAGPVHGPPTPAGPGPVAVTAAPLPRDAEEFLSWLQVERGRSPRTLAAYRRDLGTYQEGLLGRSIDQATSADVAAHLELLRRTHSNSSVARALSSLRGFHRFLVEEGLRGDDPTLDLPSVSVSDMLPKALSEEETELLLGAVVGTGPMVLRDRALLEVLYGTGARVSEVVGLNLGDVMAAVDGSDLPLLRVLGKGNKERVVPIGSLARTALADGSRVRAGPWSSRRSGPAAATPRPSSSTPGEDGSAASGSSAWSRNTPAASAWPTRSARTSCATRAPPTCSGEGPTCGSSRSSWATPPSPRPSATPRSRPSTSAVPTRAPTRGREHRGGGTA